MASPAARPPFDAVQTSFTAPAPSSPRDDVESPSLTSGNALARFEFEPGRSKDGTKVLMVEWADDDGDDNDDGDDDDDDGTERAASGDEEEDEEDDDAGWEISWDGKRTVLPARDQPGPHRLYFLLGPGVAVPAQVKLRKGRTAWRTAPLPAIFSPELGATAREAGKKGVLHTIWAKTRLQLLQREMERESRDNVEGIGYEMVVAEKEWIEQHFGVRARPGATRLATPPPPTGVVPGHAGRNSPPTPRSPGRLMDKFTRLTLDTGAHDRSSAGKAAGGAPAHNPLSPEATDVAVGSFGPFAAVKGAAPPSSSSSSSPPSSSSLAPAEPPRKAVAQRPPKSFIAPPGSHARMASLNAFARGGPADLAFSPPPAAAAAADDDDDLFALPMSPRSPDMGIKSPFSFTAQDTITYLNQHHTLSR